MRQQRGVNMKIVNNAKKIVNNAKRSVGKGVARFLLDIPEVREEFFDAASHYAEKAIDCEASNIEAAIEDAIRDARIDRQAEDAVQDAIKELEDNIEDTVKEHVQEAVSDAVNNVDTSVVEQVIKETFEVLIKCSGSPVRILMRQMIAQELSEKTKGTQS